MKCCSKKFLLTAVALTVGVIVLSRTSWGEYTWTKVKSIAKSHITPEMQIERMSQEIGKLDRDIDKGWTLIAQREKELDRLKKDVQTTQAWLENKKADMLSASADLKNNVKRVKYNGTEISDATARKQLREDVRIYESKKKSLASQEKLLESLEREFIAVKNNQTELVNAKQQLADRLASIKADLQTLKLAQTRSKYPAGDNSRLDDIKSTLNSLEEDLGVQMRALELRDGYSASQNGAATEKDREAATDEVVQAVRRVTGGTVETANGD